MEAIEELDHKIDIVSFRNNLIEWGEKHYRPFSWRFTTDPYRLLMAEVMLHRTQASQVAPVYEQFIARYPDLVTLASATREDLYQCLFSLGLRWRVDLIIDMVVQIDTRFSGQIPREKADLLSLPGISDYVASALRCFAWGLPDAIIDTNTVRVIGRVFDLEIKDSSRRNPLFRRLITALVALEDPRSYNFALLDLAAQVCTKVQQPLCRLCPVREHCLYTSKIQSFARDI